jgi:hypothetical protein
VRGILCSFCQLPFRLWWQLSSPVVRVTNPSMSTAGSEVGGSEFRFSSVDKHIKRV